MVAARFRPYILPPAVAETEDSGMTAALDARRKRLYYRSAYTGTKETDVLLGAFAARHLADLDDRQVDDYEKLLEIDDPRRSEEHTSELQSLMRISYAVFC